MSREPIAILLAEDDEGHARLIQRNLDRLGVPDKITHVRDGQEALDYVHRRGAYEGRPTRDRLVIVLDIKMPRVDGVEVLRRIKSDAATATIPVVMQTTTDDPSEIERCYQLGCSAYVTKPIPSEQFAENVCRLGSLLGIVQVPVA